MLEFADPVFRDRYLIFPLEMVDTMQNIYINYFFRELVVQIQKGIDDLYDAHKKSYLGLMVG